MSILPVLMSLRTGLSASAYAHSISTLSANQLGLLFVTSHHTASGTPPLPSVAGEGLTLDNIASFVFVDTGTQRSRTDAWRAMPTGNVGSVVTITIGNTTNILSSQWIAVSSVSTRGTNGENAISQSSAVSTTAASNLVQMILPAASSDTAANGCIAWFGSRSAGNMKEGATPNYVLLSTQSIVGQGANMLSQWTSAFLSTSSATQLQNVPVGGLLLEINSSTPTVAATAANQWINLWDVRPFQVVGA